MISFKMFYAAEARAQLYKLLKMVASGEDVIILNKESQQKFKVSLITDRAESEKLAILKQFANTNFKSNSPENIKKIIENKYSE